MEKAGSPEQLQPRIEPFEVTRQRVAEIPAVAEESTPNSLSFMYLNDGEGWHLRYGSSFPDGAYELSPNDPSDRTVIDEAIAKLPEDSTTLDTVARYLRFWEHANSGVRQEIENNLLDQMVFTDAETGLQIQILNCSSESLSEEEQSQISNAVSAVADFTGGKIFERSTRGIVLAGADQFDKKILGGHGVMNGMITINIDALRHDKESFNKRYQKYIPGRSELEITLAHELGHAMDIRAISEAEKAGIETEGKITFGWGDSTGDFSVFDDMFGWSGGEVRQDASSNWVRDWKVDPAIEIESREFSPTQYGITNPKEDFAESFAILALGAEPSHLPARAKRINEAFTLLYGAEAAKTQLESEYKEPGSPLEAPLPKELVVKAAVGKELLAATRQ